MRKSERVKNKAFKPTAEFTKCQAKGCEQQAHTFVRSIQCFLCQEHANLIQEKEIQK